MKEKLELKHLAPYLPYDLRINISPEIGKGFYHGKTIMTAEEGNTGVNISLVDGKYIKPLMHPLSRLTEPILEDDKIPLHELLRGNCFNVEKIIEEQGVEELNKYEPTFQLPFIDFTDGLKLCEWHFDVFGLIEKGLAEPIKL